MLRRRGLLQTILSRQTDQDPNDPPTGSHHEPSPVPFAASEKTTSHDLDGRPPVNEPRWWEVHPRSRAMLAAQASMACQSRKSPSGARTAFTITRSANDRWL